MPAVPARGISGRGRTQYPRLLGVWLG